MLYFKKFFNPDLLSWVFKAILSYVSHNGLDHKKNYNNILAALFDIETEENHILKREIAWVLNLNSYQWDFGEQFLSCVLLHEISMKSA